MFALCAGENPSQPGQYLHGYMMATKAEHQGRGVAKALAARLVEEARSRGYRGVMVEATTAVSQKIFTQLGGITLASKDFASFQDGDSKPYEHVEGGAHLMIVNFQ